MQPGSFFQSENEAILRSVKPCQVHGARFFDIGFSFTADPPESRRRARISDNLIYSNPRPGDRVLVQVLMGNVSRVSLQEES